MYLMLRHDEPDDYVIASGETHSVREFCEPAFNILGLDYRNFVVSDERFYRCAEIDDLLAMPRRRVAFWVGSRPIRFRVRVKR